MKIPGKKKFISQNSSLKKVDDRETHSKIIQSYRAFAKEHKKTKIKLARSRLNATHSMDIAFDRDDNGPGVSPNQLELEDGLADEDSIMSEIQSSKELSNPPTLLMRDPLTADTTEANDNQIHTDVDSDSLMETQPSQTHPKSQTGREASVVETNSVTFDTRIPKNLTLPDTTVETNIGVELLDRYKYGDHVNSRDGDLTTGGGSVDSKSRASDTQPDIMNGTNNQTCTSFEGVDSTRSQHRLTIRIPARKKKSDDLMTDKLGGVSLATVEVQTGVSTNWPPPDVDSMRTEEPRIKIKLPARSKKVLQVAPAATGPSQDNAQESDETSHVKRSSATYHFDFDRKISQAQASSLDETSHHEISSATFDFNFQNEVPSSKPQILHEVQNPTGAHMLHTVSPVVTASMPGKRRREDQAESLRQRKKHRKVLPKEYYERQEADKKKSAKKINSMKKLLANQRKQTVQRESSFSEPGPSKMLISFAGLDAPPSGPSHSIGLPRQNSRPLDPPLVGISPVRQGSQIILFLPEHAKTGCNALQDEPLDSGTPKACAVLETKMKDVETSECERNKEDIDIRDQRSNFKAAEIEVDAVEEGSNTEGRTSSRRDEDGWMEESTNLDLSNPDEKSSISDMDFSEEESANSNNDASSDQESTEGRIRDEYEDIRNNNLGVEPKEVLSNPNSVDENDTSGRESSDDVSSVSSGGLPSKGHRNTRRSSLTPGILKSRIYKNLQAQPNAPCTNASLAQVVEIMVVDHAERGGGSSATHGYVMPTRHVTPKGRSRKDAFKSRENTLHREVREFAKSLRRRNGTWRVPSEKKLRAFAKSNLKKDGPRIKKFRLDLESEGTLTRWNKHAAEVFADAFLESSRYSGWNQNDRDDVVKAFTTHLVTIKSHYNSEKRVPEQDPVMEEKLAIDRADKLKDGAHDQRRRNLSNRRYSGCKHYAEFDALMAKVLKEVWAHLDPDCMSGDETDRGSQAKSKSKSNHSKRLIITKPPWRDDVEFEPFLRVCDALYYSTRFDEDGKASAGRFPFERVPSNRMDSSSSIPKALPSNLYKQAKIQEMKESGNLEVKLLGMRAPVALVFSKNILQIAARFLHIKDRTSIPLPPDLPELNKIEAGPASALLAMNFHLLGAKYEQRVKEERAREKEIRGGKR